MKKEKFINEVLKNLETLKLAVVGEDGKEKATMQDLQFSLAQVAEDAELTPKKGTYWLPFDADYCLTVRF